MINQLITELKQTTLAQAVRMVSAAAASIMLIWSFGAPIIKPYVGQAIAQVMIEQGVAPTDFRGALTHIESIQESQTDIRSQIEKLNFEFKSLLASQSAIIAQNEDTKKRLDEIIQAIIRKQFGAADIPKLNP